MSRKWRVWLVVASTASVLATAAEAAVACNQPAIEDGSVAPTRVGPGDTAHATARDVGQGAEVRIFIDGVGEVGSGVQQSSGSLTVAFTIPDFPESQRNIRVYSVVSHDHEGGPWQSSDVTLEYREPAPAAPSEPQQQSAGQHEPAAHGSPVVQPAAVGAGGPASQVVLATEVSVRLDRSSSRRRARSRTATERPAAASVAVPQAAAAVEPRADARERATPRVAGAPARERTPRPLVARPESGIRAPSAASPAERRETPQGFPLPDLVSLALLVLAGAALGLRVHFRRQPPPAQLPVGPAPAPLPAPTTAELAVEAELQEMLSEHRAARLLGDRERAAP